MTKKVRIKAWQEIGDSAINMADRLGRQGRLGRQKFKKEFFAGLRVFYALEGHWHHQEWGRHAPRYHFIHRFWNLLLKNVIFCLWRVFLFLKIMFFGHFFGVL
jgi:hypothetical protein